MWAVTILKTDFVGVFFHICFLHYCTWFWKWVICKLNYHYVCWLYIFTRIIGSENFEVPCLYRKILCFCQRIYSIHMYFFFHIKQWNHHLQQQWTRLIQKLVHFKLLWIIWTSNKRLATRLWKLGTKYIILFTLLLFSIGLQMI
jgi:hypothetical protein